MTQTPTSPQRIVTSEMYPPLYRAAMEGGSTPSASPRVRTTDWGGTTTSEYGSLRHVDHRHHGGATASTSLPHRPTSMYEATRNETVSSSPVLSSSPMFDLVDSPTAGSTPLFDDVRESVARDRIRVVPSRENGGRVDTLIEHPRRDVGFAAEPTATDAPLPSRRSRSDRPTHDGGWAASATPAQPAASLPVSHPMTSGFTRIPEPTGVVPSEFERSARAGVGGGWAAPGGSSASAATTLAEPFAPMGSRPSLSSPPPAGVLLHSAPAQPPAETFHSVDASTPLAPVIERRTRSSERAGSSPQLREHAYPPPQLPVPALPGASSFATPASSSALLSVSAPSSLTTPAPAIPPSAPSVPVVSAPVVPAAPPSVSVTCTQGIPIMGGRMGDGVLRYGDCVRHVWSDTASPAVEVLRALDAVGFPAAPKVVESRPGEWFSLTYLEGHVPDNQQWFSTAQVRQAGQLLRTFHEAMVRAFPSDGDSLVGHGDPSPMNVVFRNGRPTALIDFAQVKMVHRMDELAYAAWMWCLSSREYWPGIDEQAFNVAHMLDGYGVPMDARSGFATRMLEVQEAAGAQWGMNGAQGHSAPERSSDMVRWVTREHAYLSHHVGVFQAVLDMHVPGAP